LRAVATVSVSKKGEVRLERFDVAMDTGPFLVNPLAAERQVEMQVTMDWLRRFVRKSQSRKGASFRATLMTTPYCEQRKFRR